jgi:ribosomal protein L16 Arg81 hydroxylase
MNPFYVKNLINKNLFNWKDFEFLLKNHEKKYVEIINQNHIKKCITNNENLENKTVIISKVLNYKKEYGDLVNFFKLKVPELNNSLSNDVHVYIGVNEKSKSFGEHCDKSANFILQTEGKSRWIVSNFLDVILEPGDAIYIPKLQMHECLPITKRISLSFPFWF